MELRKFAAMSPIIWQTCLQNVEKFAAENCAPQYGLVAYRFLE